MKKSILTTSLLLALATASFASPFAKPKEAHGIINMHNTKVTQSIFPVSINAINGKNIVSRDSAVWLKPGEYTLSVSSTIRQDLLAHTTSRNIGNSNGKNKINLTVEEGKMYYLGYDASSRDKKEWKPIVWKVKNL